MTRPQAAPRAKGDKDEKMPVDAGVYSGAADPQSTGTRAAVEAALLRFQNMFPLGTDLGLDRVYRLLGALDNPHHKLPPVIHVSGTNGKGSVIAFMRSMLESSGKRVHVFSSPHLTRFNERIRLAGELIGDEELLELIEQVEAANDSEPITFFEIITVLAFLAFSRTKADYLLLETGLGGELDASNVIDHPAATAITRISYDHRHFLGDDIRTIAAAKAGIMKNGAPCTVAEQPDEAVMPVFAGHAADVGAKLVSAGDDWRVVDEDGQLVFDGFGRHLPLPQPGLFGVHQYGNAAQAIATLLQVKGLDLSDTDIQNGIAGATWPGRLQRLKSGALVDMLPDGLSGGWEIWVDGGHNDSAGAALAQQAASWQEQDGRELDVIFGMLIKKRPDEFLTPLKPYIASLHSITIPDDQSAMDGAQLAQHCADIGLDATCSPSIADAIVDIINTHGSDTPRRILITGSIRLVGGILRTHT